MRLTELQAGINGPQAEIDYLLRVVHQLGCQVDTDFLGLVGGRANGFYLSRKRICEALPKDTPDPWKIFYTLNEIARREDLFTKNMGALIRLIPKEIENEAKLAIRRAITNGAASAWDLMIFSRKFAASEPFWKDPKTGAFVRVLKASNIPQS